MNHIYIHIKTILELKERLKESKDACEKNKIININNKKNQNPKNFNSH